MKHIAIIGNGIAGITAARYIRKLSDYKITVISAESEHFWSRTALMYIYMGHMKYHHTKPYEDWFWEKNRIELVFDYVEKINSASKELILQKGNVVGYDALIIASGSISNKFGWPGEGHKGVRGMVNLQDLDYIEKYTKDIDRGVIVGGGLLGIELAEMLLSRNIKVTFLVREDNFWDRVLQKEESEMVNRHIQEHHVDLKLKTELKEILSDENGRVKSITTETGLEIPCQFVGLTVGVRPQISFLEGSGIKTEKGILVNEYLQTNIPDVYAVGDCAQHLNPPAGRRNIEQIWYTGRIQGETVAYTICGKENKYNPGVFFNSAKFFDIEYQVYGDVPASLSENQDSFYWENKEDKKAFRIVFDKATKAVRGINLLGLRFRHEICDIWIASEATIYEVMDNLKSANFDPEFHKKYDKSIRAGFKEKFNLSNQKRQKRERKKILGIFSI